MNSKAVDKKIKPRKRRLDHTEMRGSDNHVYVYDDRYPKWIVKLMEEINPDKAPKPVPPRFPIIFAMPKSTKRQGRESRMQHMKQQSKQQSKQRHIDDRYITYVSFLLKASEQKPEAIGVGVEYRAKLEGKLRAFKSASLYFDGKSQLNILEAILKEVEKDQQLVILNYDKGVIENIYQIRNELNAKYKFKVVFKEIGGLNEKARSLAKLCDNALFYLKSKWYTL